MRITHTIDIGSAEITLDKLEALQMEHYIPGHAVIKESESSYDLVIEWTTE
jgi:hypothetical protein